MLDINAQFFGWAAAFKSEDKTSAFNCVRIENNPNGGVMIMACDEHSFGMFYDAGGKSDGTTTIIEPSRKLVSACVEKTREGSRLKIEDDLIHVTGDKGKVQVFKEMVTGKREYLNWKAFFNLIKSANEGNEKIKDVLINIHDMNKFKFKNMDMDGDKALRVFPTGRKSPIMVLIDGCEEFVGLTMPNYNDMDEKVGVFNPWWLKGLGIFDAENTTFMEHYTATIEKD